jgi:hypothetical protein
MGTIQTRVGNKNWFDCMFPTEFRLLIGPNRIQQRHHDLAAEYSRLGGI